MPIRSTVQCKKKSRCGNSRARPRYQYGMFAAHAPATTNAPGRKLSIGSPDGIRQQIIASFAGYPLTIGERSVGVLAVYGKAPFPENILAERDDVVALDGSLIRLPSPVELDRARNVPNVMDVPLTRMLSCHEVYGCFAEMLALGAIGWRGNYGLGPAEPSPRNKAMELGPRDRLSQAYWHEQQKGRTIRGPHGECVHLDLRHLGEAKLRERLPQIYELALEYLGVDPATAPIPVLPAVHYTMGGILADGRTASPLPGLYSVGECSSVGIHGANRLGSNSLTELIVFGKVAGVEAASYARSVPKLRATGAIGTLAEESRRRALSVATREGGGERIATLRREMAQSMEEGCGIYRTGAAMQATCDKLAQLKERYKRLHVDDRSKGWNTEWLLGIELGYLLDVAQAMTHSALERRESRGSHQRLDGFGERDDANFLRHSLAWYAGDAPPRVTYGPVKITRSPPGRRAYGAAGEQAEAAAHNVQASVDV